MGDHHGTEIEDHDRGLAYDHVDELVAVETDAFADRQRVAYRLRGHNDDGPFVVEQQAYFTERDGRIDWMRVLCSGFRRE